MLKKSTIVAIAGSLIVGGIGLSTVGLALGGESSVHFDSFLELSEPTFEKEYSQKIIEAQSELRMTMDREEKLDTGEVKQKGWEKLDGFSEMKVEVGTVNFNVVIGEDYKIEVDVKTNVDLSYDIRGEKLYIKQKNIEQYRRNNGFRSNLNDGTITVMIPQDAKLEEVILNLGVGEGHLEGITVNELEISNGVGSMNINNVVANNAHITGGVGDIKVEDFKVKGVVFDSGVGDLNVTSLVSDRLEANMGVGDVSIQGDIQGDIEIGGGLGSLRLELVGQEKDYNYFISRGGGHITINEMNQFGLGDVKVNNNSQYNIEIEAGLGEILIKTDK